MHNRKLNAKQTLLPCGDVMNWDSPDREDANSRLTMCDIPVFTTYCLFLHVYSAYGT